MVSQPLFVVRTWTGTTVELDIWHFPPFSFVALAAVGVLCLHALMAVPAFPRSCKFVGLAAALYLFDLTAVLVALGDATARIAGVVAIGSPVLTVETAIATWLMLGGSGLFALFCSAFILTDVASRNGEREVPAHH